MRFVLIHGGFHGAWCWSKLIPEIEAQGHAALAIDLPGHGARRDEPSNLANRAEAILEVLQDGDVLVGHSGGGFDITLAAERAPGKVGHLIYLAAGVPIEGAPLVAATAGTATDGEVEQLAEDIRPEALRTDARGWLEYVDFDEARRTFYDDCSEEDARWAFDRLTPAPLGILVEPVTLPAFWRAELPRSYVICLGDRALPFATAMAFAGRLGVLPHTIAGSHSPFLARPAELAALLVRATADVPVAPLRPR